MGSPQHCFTRLKSAAGIGSRPAYPTDRSEPSSDAESISTWHTVRQPRCEYSFWPSREASSSPVSHVVLEGLRGQGLHDEAAQPAALEVRLGDDLVENRRVAHHEHPPAGGNRLAGVHHGVVDAVVRGRLRFRSSSESQGSSASWVSMSTIIMVWEAEVTFSPCCCGQVRVAADVVGQDGQDPGGRFRRFAGQLGELGVRGIVGEVFPFLVVSARSAAGNRPSVRVS